MNLVMHNFVHEALGFVYFLCIAGTLIAMMLVVLQR